MDATDFIKVWQNARSLDEVGKATNLPKSHCATRAARYRRLGIPLKLFRNGRVPLDIKALIKLAKSFDTKNGQDN